MQSYNTYEGFRRHPVKDDVQLAALDPLGRVARSSAPAVVEVFGDRCFSQGVGNTESNWHIVQTPSTGFFVSDRVVVTDVQAVRKLAYDNLNKLWGEAPFPSNAFSCAEQAEYEATVLPPNERSLWEEGKGPFIRLFDGRWAAGKVLAQDEDIAVIEIERVTSDGNTLVDTWGIWQPDLMPGDPLPLSPSSTVSGQVLAIHHPLEARENGGWMTTTGLVVACPYLSDQIPRNRVALDLYSDRTSEGAPVLDAQGYVVGILDKFGLDQHPDVCKADRYRGKNQLGVLSEFLAAPADMASMIPIDVIRGRILGAASGLTMTPSKTAPEWTANPLTSSGARFEVLEWGQAFTASGFPKSELSNAAFGMAHQASLMFTRQTGCVLCEEEAERTGDFSVTCMCTGFAVTNYLIVTNDHCVPALNIGDETTFRTSAGQNVGAVLIGKSSIDGTKTDVHGRIYDPSGGDVALLRTRQRMDLVPVRLGNSDLVTQFDPVLAVGHPAIMARTGPYVSSAGHVIGENPRYPQNLQYTLPVHKGSSGSAVFNLDGEVIGQVANGGHYYLGEMDTTLETNYERRALTIMTEEFFMNLSPAPFEVSRYVPVARGKSTGGAPSNYIKELVEKWAPGELAAANSSN